MLFSPVSSTPSLTRWGRFATAAAATSAIGPAAFPPAQHALAYPPASAATDAAPSIGCGA